MSRLKEAYQKIFNNRIPESVSKFGLNGIFEDRVKEIRDPRILDLIQLMAWEILLLRERSKHLSEVLMKKEREKHDQSPFCKDGMGCGLGKRFTIHAPGTVPGAFGGER